MNKRRKNKRFFEPPSTTPEYGVLNRGGQKYSTLEDVSGKQPYYWYQGIGKTEADPIPPQTCNVTFESIDVTFETEIVTFKCN